MLLLGTGLILICTTWCNAANILAIVPTPSFSHQVAHQELWKELSKRGHKVTVLTTNPIKDHALTNLTEIDLSYIYEKIEKKFNRVELIWSLKENPLELVKTIVNVQKFVIEEELGTASVQELINNKNNRKFDVVLTEFLYPVTYAFAEVYKCPLIIISSMDIVSSVYNLLGNPVHPVTHPDLLMLQMSTPLSFTERLISTLFNLFWYPYVEYVLIPREDLIVKKYFGKHIPSLHQIRKNVSLAFVNTSPILYSPKPLIPTIIPIGGGAHIQSKKLLSKDLENFINASDKGVIYFSLGTNVKSENIEPLVVKGIIEVFEELPYNVVWKADPKYINTFSSKIYVSQWLPQQAILQSPKVKLFITQGGCQSLDEALHNHIPILGIPFFGDQISNVKRMVSKGVGLSLDYTQITKESFKETVLALINDSKYRIAMKQLADLVRDQPMTGLELAVWWTEYVIRHKGASHLRSPFNDLPTYQYYHLDVLTFCGAVLFLFMFILSRCLLILLRLVKRESKTKPKQQ